MSLYAYLDGFSPIRLNFFEFCQTYMLIQPTWLFKHIRVPNLIDALDLLLSPKSLSWIYLLLPPDLPTLISDLPTLILDVPTIVSDFTC